MTQWSVRGIFCGLLVPIISVSVLAQGLSFETIHQNDEAKVSKNSYMPGMFRSEEWDGHISILRLDKEMILTITPAHRTYTEITFAQMEAQLKLGRAKGAEAMKKGMEGMPPEQRKKMEERMAAMTGHADQSKTEIVATGEHKSIDGYKCTGYVVKRNGKETEKVWATRDVPNYTSLRKDFLRLSSAFLSMGMGRSAFASLEKIDGFPIEQSGTGTSEKIRKIQAGSFPMSAFEAPPGYTKEKTRGLGEEK